MHTSPWCENSQASSSLATMPGSVRANETRKGNTQMILFIDFETTNLADFNKRARDPSQPHIVSLAAEICDDKGETIEDYSAIVKPDGWTIPKEASDVHGITDEIAAEKGIPEIEVAKKLFEMVCATQLLVAFNLQFDKFIGRIALRRYDIFDDSKDAWWKALPTFCPMRAMTDICCIPAKTPGKFKFPKLSEAYEFAFKKKLEGAHGAVADKNAAKELFFWIKSLGA